MKHFAIARLLGLFAAALLALASSCSQQNQAPPAATMDSTDSNAIANAYMERQVTASFPRSYPGGKLAVPKGNTQVFH